MNQPTKPTAADLRLMLLGLIKDIVKTADSKNTPIDYDYTEHLLDSLIAEVRAEEAGIYQLDKPSTVDGILRGVHNNAVKLCIMGLGGEMHRVPINNPITIYQAKAQLIELVEKQAEKLITDYFIEDIVEFQNYLFGVDDLSEALIKAIKGKG